MISDDNPAAKKLFRQQDAAKAMSEHAKEQKRFGDNRERLKAERLAREAESALANKDTAPIKAKKTADGKRSATGGKGAKAK